MCMKVSNVVNVTLALGWRRTTFSLFSLLQAKQFRCVGPATLCLWSWLDMAVGCLMREPAHVDLSFAVGPLQLGCGHGLKVFLCFLR